VHAQWPGRARPTVHLGALALALIILVPSLAAEAQRAEKVYWVGFLGGASAGEVPLSSLREGLRELGYVEGKNVAF